MAQVARMLRSTNRSAKVVTMSRLATNECGPVWLRGGMVTYTPVKLEVQGDHERTMLLRHEAEATN